MSNKSPKYEVGQELWFASSRVYRNSQMVRIVKVGRKWLDLDGGWSGMRADKETLAVDGGVNSSPGQCYISQEAWQAERDLLTEWRFFARKVERLYSTPKGVTIESIGKAAELLGLGD